MNDNKNGSISGHSIETILTHGGRNPDEQFGFVNTPIYRGSTVLFKTLADIEAQQQRYLYGRAGNPTTDGVEAIVSELEGAYRNDQQRYPNPVNISCIYFFCIFGTSYKLQRE